MEKLLVELKVENLDDRVELVKILAVAGYGVKIKEKPIDYYGYNQAHFIQVYEK